MGWKNQRIAVLVSGGLDSDVLLAQLAEHNTVYPFFIRQGLQWESTELYWLKRFLQAIKSPTIEPLQTLSLPMDDVYGIHWSLGHKRPPGARTRDEAVYLPGRNLALMVKTAIVCATKKIPYLATAPLDRNPFPDATPAFFRQWGKTLSIALSFPLKIITPFRTFEKSEVIRRGSALPLELSFSCLSPVNKKHCGQCNKCAERHLAFRQAEVVDKTVYASRSKESGMVLSHAEKS